MCLQVTGAKLKWMDHHFKALGLLGCPGGWEGPMDPDDPMKIKENLMDLCEEAAYEFN